MFPFARRFIDRRSSFYEGPVYSLINWHFLVHMTRHLSIVKVYFMKVSFFVGITHEPFQATAQSFPSAVKNGRRQSTGDEKAFEAVCL